MAEIMKPVAPENRVMKEWQAYPGQLGPFAYARKVWNDTWARLAGGDTRQPMVTPWQQTASGGRFYPLQPRVMDVNPEDLAHHLAARNRFSGATKVPYNVAQHSILVSLRMEDQLADEGAAERDIIQAALFGLLHDGSEAYLPDMCRPLKNHASMAWFGEVETNVQDTVYLAAGLHPLRCPMKLLKLVDRRMLRTEQRDLMPPAPRDDDRNDVPTYPNPIIVMNFEQSKRMFLARYWLLKKDLATLGGR